MAEPLHDPHDKLFKSSFSDLPTAAAFFSTHIDPAVAGCILWPSLRLEPGSFVDSALTSSESDLLFSAELGGAPCRVYLLFEHQSSPDPALALRLLRYLVRIWEGCLRDAPRRPLPVIVPVVLAQNARPWNLSERFSALIGAPEDLRGGLARYIPDFGFHLVQLAALPFDKIVGTPLGIVTLRVLKAERLQQLLGDPVWDEALLLQVPPDALERIWRYLFNTASVDKRRLEEKLLHITETELQDRAMTVAEQLRQEGRQQGRLAALRESLVEVLAERFGDVPRGLTDVIGGVTDEFKLRSLHRAALRTPNLETFATEL